MDLEFGRVKIRYFKGNSMLPITRKKTGVQKSLTKPDSALNHNYCKCFK